MIFVNPKPTDKPSRYPIDRIGYCKVVGASRVSNLIDIFESFDFKVEAGEIEDHGVDLRIYNPSGFLLFVVESTNWRPSCYMSKAKALSIRDSFSAYVCPKILVVSFRQNWILQRDLIRSDVDILEFGFQTQPFFDWFLERGKAKGMRPNDMETLELERTIILGYLEEKNLLEVLEAIIEDSIAIYQYT